MAVEASVLGGDDRVLEMGRDGVGGDLAAELFAAPGKDLSVAVEKCDRPARAGVEQVVHGGQSGGIEKDRSRDGERHQYNPETVPLLQQAVRQAHGRPGGIALSASAPRWPRLRTMRARLRSRRAIARAFS